MTDDAALAHNLGRNIRGLREARGLSQQKVADLSGVPRATWANLESGSANPTLTVLTRVAGALRVSIEELLAPPRARCRLYKAEDQPARGKGRVQIRDMLPDPLPGLQIERLQFATGARFSGTPHTPGTREYLACERGRLGLTVEGQTWVLDEGDVLVFRGDQKHGYSNEGEGDSVGWSVVVLSPVGP